MSTDALRPSPESDADPADPAGAGGRSKAAGADDPRPPRTGPGLPPVPAWLNEVEGAEALAWVEARNAETLSAYRGGERFESMRESIQRILDSPDKIPGVALAAGRLYNFWTDADHPRGLWRRTTWDSYRAAPLEPEPPPEPTPSPTPIRGRAPGPRSGRSCSTSTPSGRRRACPGCGTAPPCCAPGRWPAAAP